MASLEERKDCRDVRAWCSRCRFWSVFWRAVCWAWREGRAEALELIVEWSCSVRVRERAERRASFSGFGGMGGAGRLVEVG